MEREGITVELFLLGEKLKKKFRWFFVVCSWMFFKGVVQSIVPDYAGSLKSVFLIKTTLSSALHQDCTSKHIKTTKCRHLLC